MTVRDGMTSTARVLSPAGTIDSTTRKWSRDGTELFAALPCRVVRRNARSVVRGEGPGEILVDHDVIYPALLDDGTTEVGRLAADTLLELDDGRTVRLTDPAAPRTRTTPDPVYWSAPALQVDA